MKVALVGNPNSGKSSLFNALTGAKQYVGNWPGVTVEKKEGKMKNEQQGPSETVFKAVWKRNYRIYTGAFSESQ